MPNDTMPSYDMLFQPTINALIELGNSAKINEIYEKVIELEKFSDEITSIMHGNSKTRTEIDYHLGWARTYLKNNGYLENSARGVWCLTAKAIDNPQINSKQVIDNYQIFVNKKKSIDKTQNDIYIDELVDEKPSWQEDLLKIIIEELTPKAFEHLAQRLLRESGFNKCKSYR